MSFKLCESSSCMISVLTVTYFATRQMRLPPTIILMAFKFVYVCRGANLL